MPRTDRLSNYKTVVTTNDKGETNVTYHETNVVTFDAKQITLRTGGWDSVTTRRKMNQASNQFGLGFGVYRESGKSFVRLPGQSWHEVAAKPVPLTDGMSFRREKPK